MEKKLKLVVIGGGSSYTPELIEGIIKHHPELPVGEIWLVDIGFFACCRCRPVAAGPGRGAAAQGLRYGFPLRENQA